MQYFVGEGCSKEHELTLRYLHIWVYRTPPSSVFLWSLGHCIPPTVRRRCDMHVPERFNPPICVQLPFSTA